MMSINKELNWDSLLVDHYSHRCASVVSYVSDRGIRELKLVARVQGEQTCGVGPFCRIARHQWALVGTDVDREGNFRWALTTRE